MKKNNALLIIVGLSIFSNLFKTAYVFRSVSFGKEADYLQWSYAVFSVLILEVSILVLLANGSKFFPLLFALCTFAINVYYFNQFEFGYISTNIIEVIFAALFPAIIYRFSELYYTQTNDVKHVLQATENVLHKKENLIQKDLDVLQVKQNQLLNDYRVLQKMYDVLQNEYGVLHNSMNVKQEQEKVLQANSDKWIEAVTCSQCAKTHENPFACRTHETRCKTEKNDAQYRIYSND